MTDSDLSTALADVRRAYRLLWAYQRRVLDVVQVIGDSFEDFGFYVWAPTSYGRPGQLTTNPMKKWAWDGLPFYRTSFLFKEHEKDPNELKAGDWLLEVHVDSDSADFKQYPGEPDSSRFADAELTSSTLSLIAWKCIQDTNSNWYYKVWNYSSWPEADEEPFSLPEFPVQSIKLTFPLETFDGRPEVDDAVVRFKNLVRDKLRIET